MKKEARIIYRIGDATVYRQPPLRDLQVDFTIIPHVCNNIGGFGAGFANSLKKAYPGVDKIYRTSSLTLGNVSYYEPKDTRVIIANMVCQSGYLAPGNPVPLNYRALTTCLHKVQDMIIGMGNEYPDNGLIVTVQMPRIGTGLAGGDWKFIEPILKDKLVKNGLSVNVYDLEPVEGTEYEQ